MFSIYLFITRCAEEKPNTCYVGYYRDISCQGSDYWTNYTNYACLENEDCDYENVFSNSFKKALCTRVPEKIIPDFKYYTYLYGKCDVFPEEKIAFCYEDSESLKEELGAGGYELNEWNIYDIYTKPKALSVLLSLLKKDGLDIRYDDQGFITAIEFENNKKFLKTFDISKNTAKELIYDNNYYMKRDKDFYYEFAYPEKYISFTEYEVEPNSLYSIFADTNLFAITDEKALDKLLKILELFKMNPKKVKEILDKIHKEESPQIKNQEVYDAMNLNLPNAIKFFKQLDKFIISHDNVEKVLEDFGVSKTVTSDAYKAIKNFYTDYNITLAEAMNLIGSLSKFSTEFYPTAKKLTLDFLREFIDTTMDRIQISSLSSFVPKLIKAIEEYDEVIEEEDDGILEDLKEWNENGINVTKFVMNFFECENDEVEGLIKILISVFGGEDSIIKTLSTVVHNMASISLPSSRKQIKIIDADEGSDGEISMEEMMEMITSLLDTLSALIESKKKDAKFKDIIPEGFYADFKAMLLSIAEGKKFSEIPLIGSFSSYIDMLIYYSALISNGKLGDIKEMMKEMSEEESSGLSDFSLGAIGSMPFTTILSGLETMGYKFNIEETQILSTNLLEFIRFLQKNLPIPNFFNDILNEIVKRINSYNKLISDDADAPLKSVLEVLVTNQIKWEILFKQLGKDDTKLVDILSTLDLQNSFIKIKETIVNFGKLAIEEKAANGESEEMPKYSYTFEQFASAISTANSDFNIGLILKSINKLCKEKKSIIEKDELTANQFASGANIDTEKINRITAKSIVSELTFSFMNSNQLFESCYNALLHADKNETMKLNEVSEFAQAVRSSFNHVESTGLSAVAIAFIVIGCVIGVACIAGAVYYFFFMRKEEAEDIEGKEATSMVP